MEARAAKQGSLNGDNWKFKRRKQEVGAPKCQLIEQDSSLDFKTMVTIKIQPQVGKLEIGHS